MPQQGLIEFELWSKSDWSRRDVVGESFYAAALRPLFPRQIPDGGQERMLQAALIPEPTNRHDRNAVKVMIGGEHVGHLPREDAAVYQPVLLALVQRGFLPVTSARVWASEYERTVGTDRRGREIVKLDFQASVTVTLDEWYLCVPMNEAPTHPHAMLPHGAALQLRKEENHQDVLRRYVSRQGECWVYGTLRAITEQSARTSRELVEVHVDGQRVGELTPAMSAEFLPIINLLAEQGRVAGARLIVKGNQVKADVVLHAKKANQLDDGWIAANLRNQPNPPHRSPAPAIASPAIASPAIASTPAAAAVARTVHAPVPPRPTRIVFVVPPGWPPAPAGWEPVPGWQPDPAWPAAPDGWDFWRTA